jgi:purine-cytosine permease-like protein
MGIDEEKGTLSTETPSAPSVRIEPTVDKSPLQSWFEVLNKLQGMEARGIERVTEEMREAKVTARSYVQMFLIWFSINCAAKNMTVGILGPVAFDLGFNDVILCALFGTIFGSLCTGYISTFGPLIVARYAMGYCPSRLYVLLNIVIELGYGLIDSLVTGLMLSAVNGDGMSVVTGIVVSSLVTWAVATFSIKRFHAFERPVYTSSDILIIRKSSLIRPLSPGRYVWFPTALLFVMIGCAGPNYNFMAEGSAGTGAALAGARVSYFFLAASGPLGWAPASADFYPYYPANISRPVTAVVTALGITCGKLLIELLCIGLASGLGSIPKWSAALDQSPGALIVRRMRHWERLGTSVPSCRPCVYPPTTFPAPTRPL